MASYSSTEQALIDAGTPKLVDYIKTGGRPLKAVTIKATHPTGFAQDEIVTVWTPPKGWKWAGGLMGHDANGASITCVVGITGDTNKFMVSKDVSAAGDQVMANPDGIDYEFDGSTAIIATFGGGNPTDGADQAFTLFFT